MAQEIDIWKNAPALPADLVKQLEDMSNLEAKETVPALSYEGKVWSISIEGNKQRLMRKTDDGDEPLAVFKGVILDYAEKRGRAFYEGAYDPAKKAKPACWSNDGVTPDAMVASPKSVTCGKCPLSVKGSKVTDQGKDVAACSQHRMLAIVPATKLDFDPLRLKIAMTSDWDGQSPDHQAQGWYAFQNYRDALVKKGAPHTALVVTKIKFDPKVAYPKLLFAWDSHLSETDVRSLIPVIKGPVVKSLLDGTWTPEGPDGQRRGSVGSAPVGARTPTVEPTGVEPPVENDDGAGKAIAAAQAQATKLAADQATKRAAKQAALDAAVAAAAAAKAAMEDDDSSGEIILPGTTSPAAEAAKVVSPVVIAPQETAVTTAPPKALDIPNKLKEVLGGW